jgi:hypothetical protein
MIVWLLILLKERCAGKGKFSISATYKFIMLNFILKTAKGVGFSA